MPRPDFDLVHFCPDCAGQVQLQKLMRYVQEPDDTLSISCLSPTEGKESPICYHCRQLPADDYIEIMFMSSSHKQKSMA